MLWVKEFVGGMNGICLGFYRFLTFVEGIWMLNEDVHLPINKSFFYDVAHDCRLKGMVEIISFALQAH